MEKKKYEVWMEGYAASGESGGASYEGEAEGNTFLDACRKKFENRDDYDPERNTIWGCRLFDNEADARKSFG